MQWESNLEERGEVEEEICPVYPKTNMARFVLSWSSHGKFFIESQVVSMEPLEGQGAVHRRYPWENLTDEDDQACLGRLIISVEYWACISFPAKGYVRSGDGLPRQELPLQPGMVNRGARTVLIHGLSHPGRQQVEQGRTMEGPCSLLALHRSEYIKPGPQSSSW